MRFNILVAISFITLAFGAVIPANHYGSREIKSRGNLDGDAVKIFVREPKKKQQPVYHVPAGGSRPAVQSFSRKEVRHSINAAKVEHARLQALAKHSPGGVLSGHQKKKSELKEFRNYPHANPHHAGPEHSRPIAGAINKLHEYPLPNKNPHDVPGTKGPARIILEERRGKIHFKGGADTVGFNPIRSRWK
ncbi:hypothetical protein CPB83DRAFT_886163 [Crepidotus variabilis]|uniref:Uncharacterized protein n=1 Tax=Crepidotus variabilis TaxID=179855 RepID=A0A9P6JLE7_9AGAR|nr:hypothetical protein CPB83DRAFT_886163 [Crepidotus variabilis]